ncbi:MAG: TolC family protein [Gemmatimonadota bacterium]|nr:TolC family protein [Gemmatimonadota bacterium]
MSFVLKTALLFATAAVLSAPVAAEETATRDMHLSLSECIEIALANNTDIAQARFAREIAVAGIDQSRNAFLPSLGSNYRISRSVTGPREGAIFDQTTQTIVTTLGRDRVGGSQSVGSSLSINIFDAADFANLAASKKSARAAEMDFKESRQQTIFLVKQRYFILLQRTEQLDLAKEQVSVSEESLRREKTMYEIGSRTIADVLSAESQLASVRVALIARENDVAIARAQLAFSLGLSPDVAILPTETAFSVTPAPVSYQESLERALIGNPQILAQKQRMLASRDRLRATKYSVRFPSITGSAGYGWQLNRGEVFAGVEDLFVKNYSYNAGISISIPIFNRLLTENNVKTQKLEYLRSRELLDQAKRQQAMDIRLSFLNLERLRRSITANEAAVKAAEENFRLQDQRYNLGGGTFLERQQAQLQLFEARNQLVQDRFQYQIELAQLEQHVGGPLAQTSD